MTRVLNGAGPVLAHDVPRALDLGIVVDGQGRDGMPFRVPLSVLTGQVLVAGDTDEVTQACTCLLGQLSAAGIPWLRVGRLPARTPDPSAVTVVDLTDPRGIPLTIDPFLPEPGYPDIAHADALSALLEAVFGPPGPYRDVLALALRGLYAARAPNEPAPATSQIERAVLAAARELGYGDAAEATLRGFVRARLGGMRGPATGMLLGGGHPADTAELVRRDVDLVTGDVGGPEGRALLAGAVALRIAEHARRFPRAPGLPRHVLMLEDAGLLLDGSHAARQVARLLRDAGAHGTGIVIAVPAPVPAVPWLVDGVALTVAYGPCTAMAAGTALRRPVRLRVPRPAGAGRRSAGHPLAATGPGPVSAVPRPLPAPDAYTASCQPSVAGLVGHRMAGCARSCRAGKPCARDEIAAAATMAAAPGQEAAWLRLWVRVLLLAFLTGRPLPAVPPPLRAAARTCPPRVMECALAAIAEPAAAERASAVGDCFPVASLTRALTGVAADMLAGRRVPVIAGQVWVIPQLRWAHEATRVGWARAAPPPGVPLRGTVRPGDLAPPLDFGIAGLPDWTGMLARDRLRALLRHPLSLEAAANRGIAAAALLGEHGQEAFDAALAADLAAVSPAFPASRTIHANFPASLPAATAASLPAATAGSLPAATAGSLPAATAGSLPAVARLMGCDGDWLVTVMRWTSIG